MPNIKVSAKLFGAKIGTNGTVTLTSDLFPELRLAYVQKWKSLEMRERGKHAVLYLLKENDEKEVYYDFEGTDRSFFQTPENVVKLRFVMMGLAQAIQQIYNVSELFFGLFNDKDIRGIFEMEYPLTEEETNALKK